ncbi:cytochrome d ubiquinol oxidase subunit II [Phytoactinopolyspora halotolerans]|uniref:Cytochrome d ubiquinol oxidase subunit II n=1 Tax=Phytoactinopolyspora halotolerans TaxID=1981512 RepID=A0A6L9SCC7_9ACTN|nr:cytochrome d ubiquinol oxidase subunit II [Phytoactinopolyspora halotolerans]
METAAVVVLAFYAIGYFVLGGGDIGVGMLLPFLAGDAGERRLVVAAIVPFFLSNEVWLVAAAGVLIGLFPSLDGDLLGGLFPLIVAILAGWILRDAGVWFRGRLGGDERAARTWRATCDAAVTAGSWVVAAGWSWVLAGWLSGKADGVLTEPQVVAAIVALLTLFALHGVAFCGLRLDGPVRERCARWFGGAAERRTFVLTSTVLAAVVVVAGSALPFAETVGDGRTLDVLLPAVVAVTPVLLAAQVWVWRVFGRRVSDPRHDPRGRIAMTP